MQTLSYNGISRTIVYYILLLLVFLSWQDASSLPNGAFRMCFMIAVFVPVLIIRDKSLIPPLVIVFNTLATMGYTSSYMPAMWYTYVVAIFLMLIITERNHDFSKEKRGATRIFIAILFISTFIDLINNGEFATSAGSLLIIVLIIFAVDFHNIKTNSLLQYSFIIISLVLSLQYLTMRIVFVESQMIGGIERQGFRDINYSACAISLGVMVCLIQIFSDNLFRNVKKLILIILTFILSMSVLAQNASRGSFLCIIICLTILIVFSKMKISHKILISIALVSLIIGMEYSGYFELLEYRLDNDDKTGSRIDIWANKIADFEIKSNVMNFLFGCGMQGGRDLGGGSSTHNDFLSFFLYYGLVGLVLFVVFIMYPYIKSNRNNKAYVAAGTLGLISISFTLEPFAKGMIPYYGFWMYLLALGQNQKE